MGGVVEARLGRVAQLLDEGVRFCEHVVLAHHEGASLNICALCVDGVGLMCFACWGRHFHGVHDGGEAQRCDYCLGNAATLKQFDATHPSVVLFTPGAAEPTTLALVTFSVFGTPWVCKREVCRQRMAADIAATEMTRAVRSDTPPAG